MPDIAFGIIGAAVFDFGGGIAEEGFREGLIAIHFRTATETILKLSELTGKE
ncbi:MAG: hypothetical protein HGA78_07475 [Nitrospirales bacterium]|nr:hypothetical protein [Nitrospirales bacterium]